MTDITLKNSWKTTLPWALPIAIIAFISNIIMMEWMLSYMDNLSKTGLIPMFIAPVWITNIISGILITIILFFSLKEGIKKLNLSNYLNKLVYCMYVIVFASLIQFILRYFLFEVVEFALIGLIPLVAMFILPLLVKSD